jgi:hypothetical protein
MPSEAPSEQLVAFFKTHIGAQQNASELDVALNIASGTGKQHAALLAAALQLGYGVRLVSFENGQLTVLT